MDQPQATRTVTVANRQGLHARAALAVVNLVRELKGEVALVYNQQRVSATDILGIMTLGACVGTEVVLEAAGPNADSVLDALAQLFADKFHEEDA